MKEFFGWGGYTRTPEGFCSLYIGLTGMASLKKKNIVITVSVLMGFAVCADIANHLLDYNYMFLERGDGTPYDILYNLVGGQPILYHLGVILLFLLYIVAFYGTYYLICAKRKKADAPSAH